MAKETSPEYEDNSWALEKLIELCEVDPERGFETIEEILKLNSTDAVLARVAAGPMEDLLVRHGRRFIERIEQLAVVDATFRKMLGAVWKNNIPDDIWDRVKSVSGPTF